MHYKIAISNIAWRKDEDGEVYSLMKKNGVFGLEIAPSRTWENPYEQDDKTINIFLELLGEKGITVVGFQSLLFGHPEFAIFQDEKTRNDTMEYLKKNIILAGKFDAKALVFGSPKNRIIGDMEKEEAHNIALTFFGELGRFAFENNTCFCIEPNPKIYGGDFILTTGEAIELVKNVNHPGFKLNIDLGTITANGEDIETALRTAIPHAGHFHISEPFLKKIDNNKDKHKKIKELLHKYGYSSALSVEMKGGEPEISNIKNIQETLNFIGNIYND
ncbi:MAG: hypothetical protein UX02_C0002G0398 [Candidatus Moranbacteria bacterium GW2011_GWC1_45_18]|nr:MAG: Sugar or sugar nucleotide oxidoreductase [Candidatus Moranbacteria bacterium GW2011_GWC2_40_12]KKT32673.1 MAG: Sugar or sugar nucleotide oxidoreductase [Candidatus Moranbacteria bacterium GW2011_GWF2_44_10]KKU00155.1 MAG: hypothetical protein UX02_C0002G0398 [Candidatus Moranbacteria bacterium GW2011_GWC1_45_18]OGI35217.1 MAG: hypothetical protein A2407_00665 [Candidatus Moranbacteria bacterium RIFOXYC1_FULL_44_8]OGI39397.1 MAG: hypothetical protein A2374_01670 [Candidatus Moranbacteria